MQVLQVADGFLCYRFPPRPGRHFGFNLYALIDGRRALLIDTGFGDHARILLAELASRGVAPEAAILSHFHDDHVFGLTALPPMAVYGSPRYRETFDRYPISPEEGELFRPCHLLSEETELAFGPFRLRFLVMPGHAPCDAYTLINDEWLHAGDDLMFSNDGAPLLPSVEGDRIQDHIDSLERLRGFSDRTFLLAHGPALQSAEAVSAAIEDRLSYLRAVRTTWPRRIPIEQATAGCSCEFLHQEWHEELYQ